MSRKYKILVGLLTFNALSALGGGAGLVTGTLPVPTALLRHTPFDSYVIPGLFLGIAIGGSALVGAIALLAHAKRSRLISAAAGFIMIGWIAGETILVEGFSWLQGLYLLTGLLVVVGAWYLPVFAHSPEAEHLHAVAPVARVARRSVHVTDLYADTARGTGTLDALGRETHVGLGPRRPVSQVTDDHQSELSTCRPRLPHLMTAPLGTITKEIIMVKIKEAATEFLATKRVAVTGVSSNPSGHAGNIVYQRLRQRGYEVFAVNPNAETVDGDRAYPNLTSIPGGVEAVVIGTRPETAEATMRECAELGIKHVWMHRSAGKGSVSPAATEYGRQHGITVIDGGCPLMFDPTADFGHKCMRFFLGLSGAVPKQVA